MRSPDPTDEDRVRARNHGAIQVALEKGGGIGDLRQSRRRYEPVIGVEIIGRAVFRTAGERGREHAVPGPEDVDREAAIAGDRIVHEIVAVDADQQRRRFGRHRRHRADRQAVAA